LRRSEQEYLHQIAVDEFRKNGGTLVLAFSGMAFAAFLMVYGGFRLIIG